MNGDTITSTNGNGIEVFKNTTDASNVLTVKNAQGYIKYIALILMLIILLTIVNRYYY